MKYKELLSELLNNSYAPYSNYHVASIVEMQDGTIFKGVNVENASYGGTICAERNAINAAIVAGYKKGDFGDLYVMVSGKTLGFPCFICRQSIVEFFDLDKNLFLLNNENMAQYKLSDIIVHPFSAEDLK